MEGGEAGWDAMYEKRIKVVIFFKKKRTLKHTKALYKDFCINAKSKLTILCKIFVNVQFFPFH